MPPARRPLLLAAAGALVALAAAVPPASAGEAPPFAAVLDRVERHAVVVVVRFRKDLETHAEGADRIDPDSTPEVFRRWRMSLRVPGFVVGDRRTVLLSDLFLARGSIGSVEVVARGGAPVAATLEGFLPRCGAAVVRASDDLAAEPLVFPAAVATPSDVALFVGSIGEGLRGDEAWAEALGTARRLAWAGRPLSYGAPERATAGLSGSRLSRTADLVVRGDGTPVGFRFGSSVDLDASVWKGPDVVADLAAAPSFRAVDEVGEAFRASGSVVGVRLAYRADDDEEDAFHAVFSPADEGGPEEGVVHYGLAVSPGRVLVPGTLPDAWVRRIEAVTVDGPGGAGVPARFEGRVRGLGAFVVATESPLSRTLPDAAAPAAPPPEAAFLVHRVAFRAGARRDRTDFNRSLGTSRGYGDARLFCSEEPVPLGAFLLDLRGAVLGFACDLLPEDVDAELPDAARARRAVASRGVVAALFAERGGARALADDLDRRVMPPASAEERALPWLGVEHEGLDRDVAEALGVSGPTLDGTRGRIVTFVHAGSPAARAGLREGDVLLSARRTGGPGAGSPPVDLRDGDPPVYADDGGDAPRLWRPRSDGIVRLLEAWGEGATYVLSFCREGVVRSAALAVERSPRDWSTARRARDAATGLSVRELTYEVRHALRMAADAPGVVVSRVEEGSPAAQARLQPNEVLREMDGLVLSSPEDVTAVLGAARAAGKASVRAVALRLGRSRFVDLALGAPPTPASETAVR